METKDELQKTRKKEAAINKENKDNKKEEKKLSKENETLVRSIVTEMERNNAEKQEANLAIMKQLTQSMANTVNIEIKNTIVDLTDKVATAIKDGMIEANRDKTNQKNEDPLATQEIITEIHRINERLDRKQRNKETTPEEVGTETTHEPNGKPHKNTEHLRRNNESRTYKNN